MTTAIGGSSRGNTPSSIEWAGPLTAGRLAFLLALGSTIVLLHNTVDYPFKIPGRHGLEAMALLALARLSSTDRWAATIAASSAAATAIAFGTGGSWLTPFFYFVPGIAIDLGVLLFAGWRSSLIILPIIAAFAFALKPVFRLFLADTFGMTFNSFSIGTLYPISTHLVFGFTGAMATMLTWAFAHRKRRDTPARR
jgi:hypothetical protein